jgi:hypothetical protein
VATERSVAVSHDDEEAAMFVQVIDAHTKGSLDELQRLDKEWDQATEGRRTIRRSLLLQDRADPSHVVIVAFFDDAESARVNSELPETDALARTLMAKAVGEPTFTDFDLKEEKNY